MNILLVDDHVMVREGLRAILERESDVQLVMGASDGHAALRIARDSRFDVVVMDVRMPGLNGVDATREFVRVNRRVKIVGLSGHSGPEYVRDMFAAGAAGYLLKDAASSELVKAIRTVLRHQKYVSPGLCLDVGVLGVRSAMEVLSSRERQVLQLLAEGGTSGRIARTLHVALSTIETHRHHVMTKLGIHSVAGLTKYAIREGLTDLDR